MLPKMKKHFLLLAIPAAPSSSISVEYPKTIKIKVERERRRRQKNTQKPEGKKLSFSRAQKGVRENCAKENAFLGTRKSQPIQDLGFIRFYELND